MNERATGHYRILIADDEEDVVDLIDTYLVDEGFATVRAYDGEETWEIFQESQQGGEPIHLILLDVMMPKMDGFTLCRRIRKVSDVPIIMLTARGEDIDKIVGLELGADDYIPKPFNPREVVARIRAVLRRSYAPPESEGEEEVLEFHEIRLDPARREVTVRGEPINLTVKEFDLLHFLMKHPGRVFSRPQLLDHVWGADAFVGSRTVDVHIRRLREQIEPEPSNPRYILTVWGVGYKFADE